MNEFVTSLAEPSYLVPLALASAPFSPTDDPRFFFKSEHIEQRVNLLLHLIRASDKVALLFAEQGLGKSALLTQLQQSMSDDVRVCRINVEPLITPSALTLLCLRAMGVDDSEIQSSTDHTALLQKRCHHLQNLNIKSLLLIDDANLLSEDSLATILDWLSWRKDEQFLLQAVLTAKHTMPELNTIHGRIQRVDLPGITETELSAYLMHRLTAAGYQGELPFKVKTLKQIFKQSEGKPELINQLAHQKLLGVSSTSSLNKFNLSALLKWISVGILVVLLALLLIFQDKINALFTSTETEIELDQLSEVIPEKSITTVVAEPNLVKQEEVIVELPTTQSDLSEKPQLEEQGRVELEALVAELSAVDIKQPQGQSIKSEEIIPPDTVILQPTEKVSSEIALQEKNVSHHQHEWILQQKSGYYTFQLMGSWDEEKVIDFMAKYELTGDVATFKSKRSGRIWHALIYGAFESKDAALQASSAWSAPLNTLPKWLRRFDSVQQQLKTVN